MSKAQVDAAVGEMIRRFLRACALAGLTLALGAGAASAGVANEGLPGASSTNPIAGIKWGIYRGHLDGLYPYYRRSRGENRRLVAKEALRPHMLWEGAWDTDSTSGQVAREIINASGGPNVLTEIALFRLEPWEQQACSRLPSHSQQIGYENWINNLARGIFHARVLLLLQPDLPFSECQPGHSRVSLNLVKYAAKALSPLRHASIYIDAGAADYLSAGEAARMLEQAGIQYVRGFALNTTHSDSTGRQLLYGAKVTRLLGAAHINNRHFVINTAQNGAPFRIYAAQQAGVQPQPCKPGQNRFCLKLGIPPGTDVANPRWKLTRTEAEIALAQCDGYVWTSRPWLYNGNYPFVPEDARLLAETNPF